MTEKDSYNVAMQNSQSGGGGVITKNEYINLVNSLNNTLNILNNSIIQLNNEIQKTKQMIIQSHNINSSKIENLTTGILRCMPKIDIDLRVGLAEHCNLNCAGCDHFSPLAQPMLADFEKLQRDFYRVSDLLGERVTAISFQGGEPLLHPEITKIFIMSRKIFPKARIYTITNGLKLLTMSDEFWNACREYDIEINPTKYPISIDYEAIKNKAENFGVKFKYFNEGQVVKTLFKLPLDLKGTQNYKRSFFDCHRANWCTYLQDGRIYTCTVAPTARHFDKYFGTKLFNEEVNSIDIYKAQSAEEILEFLSKPIPFCRYCKIQSTTYNIEWHKSNRDINEWT